MKTINDIKAQIEKLENELTELSKPITLKYKALKDELQAAYDRKFDSDIELKNSIIDVTNSTDLTSTDDEWLSQWAHLRCKFKIPKDREELEALNQYLNDQGIYLDAKNECLTYSIGPCIIINDDGSVYDQDSGKWIFKNDDYESIEERDAAIDLWMNKHGYFPSIVKTDHYNNFFYYKLTKTSEAKMKNKTKQEKRIEHITKLAAIFNKTYEETKFIFQKLKGIEMNGHKASEQYCDGYITSDDFDLILEKIKTEIRSMELPQEIILNIYLNGDPRGYFLKLDDDFVRQNNINIERDWGGYGIFCPEGI